VIGVVLAGGSGRRLLPLTMERPKPFLRFMGRALYEYSLEEFSEVSARLDEVILVVPPGHSARLPPGRYTVLEQKGKDIEGALSTAYSYLESREARGTVVVSFVGYISRPRGIIRQLIDLHYSSPTPVSLIAVPITTGAETYGFLTLRGGKASEFLWEPFKEEKSHGYVFAGVMALSMEALGLLASEGYSEGLSMLAGKGLVSASIWTGGWAEIGYPWDFLEAARIVLPRERIVSISEDSSIAPSAVITHGVVIDSGAVVEEGVVIRGPAYIGRRAVLSAGSVIGPYTVIEEGAYVGEVSVVKESIVMEGAHIGPHSLVERSIIGHDARIRGYMVARAGRPKGRDIATARLRKGESVGVVVAPRADVPFMRVCESGEVVGGV